MTTDKKPYRILVIEDNPGDFVLVEEMLVEQMLNPVIVHALSFKQASEILSPSCNGYDVILLDLSLPDKSGEDLINEMLQIISSCPVIILTGYADIEFSIKSISAGILDYLLKDDLTSAKLYKSIIYSIERMKMIIELKESEKRYSDLFYLSPQPMWVYNTVTSRFVQVNKAASTLYGYSEEEFLKLTVMQLCSLSDVAATKEVVCLSKEGTDEICKGTCVHKKKSGETIEVELYDTPIIINDQHFRSVIAIDVTEKNLYQHKIIKAIIKSQEDERYEIGGELHDNVCQVLAVSQMNLQMLRSSLPASEMEMYNMCRDNISLALTEIRNLSHRLAPVFFNETTLEEAFSRLIAGFNVEEKHEILLHVDDAVKNYTLSLDIQLNLYRILQEQLRNILKYAKASVIEVEVRINNNQLRMKVADNGVGFNARTVRTGIGLANMKRRAELFSGRFRLISSPGDGCIIIIDLPLQQMNALQYEMEAAVI